jgi:hypothetical protein
MRYQTKDIYSNIMVRVWVPLNTDGSENILDVRVAKEIISCGALIDTDGFRGRDAKHTGTMEYTDDGIHWVQDWFHGSWEFPNVEIISAFVIPKADMDHGDLLGFMSPVEVRGPDAEQYRWSHHKR